MTHEAQPSATETDILRVYERVVHFGNLPPLPAGWFVIQLDSGHYQAVDGTHESCITINRFHARKWALQMANTYMAKP